MITIKFSLYEWAEKIQPRLINSPFPCDGLCSVYFIDHENSKVYIDFKNEEAATLFKLRYT